MSDAPLGDEPSDLGKKGDLGKEGDPGKEQDHVELRAQEHALTQSWPSPPDFCLHEWKKQPQQLSPLAQIVCPARLHANAQLGKRKRSEPCEGKAEPLSKSVALKSSRVSDFYRRASWAPDGSVILATTESQRAHILAVDASTHTAPRLLHASRSPSPLLDAVWYPIPASSVAPHHEGEEEEGREDAVGTTAWCFAESHRDLPIRLTSSVDGSSRGSYAIMDHVERYIGPHSLAFSPDLSRMYCGVYGGLAVVPLSQPGLNTHSSLPLSGAKGEGGGQRGIVSALTTTAYAGDSEQELVAVGTYDGTVGIYAIHPASLPAAADHTATVHNRDEARRIAQRSCLAGWREVEGEGITQLKFHPALPHILFVASRKSDHICVYDTRYLFGNTNRWSFRPLLQPSGSNAQRGGALLARLYRPGSRTHQRLHFDIDWAGRMLAAGDQDGTIRIWKIDGSRFTDSAPESESENDEDLLLTLEPVLVWQAHADAIGSVSFHPFQPWLLSVSGSRHWPEAAESSSSADESDGSNSSDSSEDQDQSRKNIWSTRDSSLRIWSFDRAKELESTTRV